MSASVVMGAPGVAFRDTVRASYGQDPQWYVAKAVAAVVTIFVGAEVAQACLSNTPTSAFNLACQAGIGLRSAWHTLQTFRAAQAQYPSMSVSQSLRGSCLIGAGTMLTSAGCMMLDSAQGAFAGADLLPGRALARVGAGLGFLCGAGSSNKGRPRPGGGG